MTSNDTSRSSRKEAANLIRSQGTIQQRHRRGVRRFKPPFRRDWLSELINGGEAKDAYRLLGHSRVAEFL